MNQLYLKLLKAKARFENPQTKSFNNIKTNSFSLEQLFDLNDDQRVELYNSLRNQLPSNNDEGLNRTGINKSLTHQTISDKLVVLKEIDNYILNERALELENDSKQSLKKELLKDMKKKQFEELTKGKTAAEIEAMIKSL